MEVTMPAKFSNRDYARRMYTQKIGIVKNKKGGTQGSGNAATGSAADFLW